MERPPPLQMSRSGSGSRERLYSGSVRVVEGSSADSPSSSDPIGDFSRRNMANAEGSVSGTGFNPVIKQGHHDEMDDEKVNLDAIKKILLQGEEEELLIALFETQQILKNCQEFALQILVPIICEKALEWSYNIKLSAAEALMAAVASGVPTSLAKTIGKTAYEIINLPCDQLMCDMWGDLLVATIPVTGITWSSSRVDEVIDLLEKKYEASGNSVHRQLAARILGSLATCSRGDNLHRIMDRAIVITDDKDPQVRGMIAESLASIGASLPISGVEKDLWPCLVKLLNDTDARIRAVSIRTLSLISAAHRDKNPSSRLFTQLLPPVFMQECTTVRRDAAKDLRSLDEDLYLLLEINALVFGELLFSCRDHLNDDISRKEAFKAFLAMCTCNGPVIRKHCAYNMPAVAVCLNKAFGSKLSSVVEFLSRDAAVEARWMLAAGMHETVKVLARGETRENLFNAVHVLIQDAEYLVRSAALQHFEELIVELAKHFGYYSAQKLTPLFQNLQLLAKGQWRTQELLARQLQLAAPLVPPPSLKMDVLPMLYLMAEGGASQVRKAAMAAAAICIRYIPDVADRDEVMKSLNLQWARGSIYWMRIAYIDSAEAAVDVYSRCLFRDTYGPNLLLLAKDTVPNVRLRIALLLPKAAPACHQMEEFESAVEVLKGDIDKGVAEAARDIDENIRKSLAAGLETFEEDLRLEDEEQNLYSRHLYAQRAAQRTKNALKRRPGALLGKAAKGLQGNSQKRESHALLDDSVVPTGSSRDVGQSPSKPKRSNSFAARSSESLENITPNMKAQVTPGKQARRAKAASKLNLKQTPANGDRVESPSSTGAISFKGFKHLMSPKHSNNSSRKGSRSRKSLA